MVTATVCKSSTCLLYFILKNYLKNPSTSDPSLFNTVNLFSLSSSLSHLKIAAVNPLLWSNVSPRILTDYRLFFPLLRNASETLQPSTRFHSSPSLEAMNHFNSKIFWLIIFSCRINSMYPAFPSPLIMIPANRNSCYHPAYHASLLTTTKR